MKALLTHIKKVYAETFNGDPIVVASPGRINLIGEHTDYNDGFVLPAAIDKGILFMMSPNAEGLIRLKSLDLSPSYCEMPIQSTYEKTGLEWADYVIGVISQLQKAGHVVQGFDCVFGGDLPIGAGLSSSAALEGGIAYGLSQLFGFDISRPDLAKLSQKAENEFVGVQCGIMDQFASIMGKANSVLKLDCRNLAFEYYPFQWDNVAVLLCDSNVRRTLAGSEYNVRRKQCEEGVEIMKNTFPHIQSLRDVTQEMMESVKSELSEVIYNRCSYVVSENQRVLDACAALENKDLAHFGTLMYESHYGLKNKYEVSCDELDVLVDATKNLDGIIGARMMGGGFGGCTINLVKVDHLEECKSHIRAEYLKKVGKEPSFHVVRIGQGTHLHNV